MTLYSDMLEYRLPKLSRAEVKTERIQISIIT
jgi:hypothetical protein